MNCIIEYHLLYEILRQLLKIAGRNYNKGNIYGL